MRNPLYLSSFRLLLLFAFALVGWGSLWGQCGPFQVYESFTTALPTQGGTWAATSMSYGTSNPRSGLNNLDFNASGDIIRTPLIANPGVFSFWYRRSSNTTAWSCAIETSPDNSTWTSRGTITTITASYQQYSIDLGALGLTNVYVRIKDTRASGTQVRYIDDLSWTSTVASNNTVLIQGASCTPSLVCGTTYTLYDRGGVSDEYNISMTSSPIVLTPSDPTKKIKITFTAINTEADNDYVKVYNGPTIGATALHTGSGFSGYPLTPLPTALESSHSTGSLTVDFTSDISVNYAGFVASIECVTPPTCFAPSISATTSITPSTATINWTAPSPAPSSGYEWEVRTSGLPGSGGAAASGSVAAGVLTANATGLTANTAYTVYVRSNCGGSDFSIWASGGAFTTPCNPYTVPYFQGFESGFLHNTTIAGCHSQASITGTELWTANTSLTDYNRTPRTGAWNAFLRWSNEDWLFIPINLTGGTSYTVSVYARQDGGTSANSNIAISYGTTNSSAGMTNSIVAATGIVNGGYQLISGAFTPASTDTYYVGIKGFMNGSPFYISLDDISIDVSPSCFQPNLATTTSIAANTATINWTAPSPAPSNGYEWEVRTSGLPGSGGAAASGSVAAGVLTANATGLTANTAHTVYVRSNCGGSGFSTWASGGAFTTTCNPITSFPWTENFDAATTPALPSCWSQNNANADGDSWITYTGYAQSGANSAGLYTDFNGGVNDDWLISPPITLTGNQRIKWSYRARSSGEPNDYRVMLSTTGSAPADFTNTIQALTSISNTAYATVTPISLASYSGTVYIAFHVPSGGLDGYYLYIDDVIVEDIPSCFEPTSLALTPTSTTGGDLSWTNSSGAGDYIVEFGPVGYTPGTSGSAGATGTLASSTATTPYALGGLTANTAYDVYVRKNCGAGGFSVNVGPVKFLPGDICANAQDLSTLTSPYSATTVGYGDNISTCRTGSPDRIFYIDVPCGYSISIGESSNDYNEWEYIGRGLPADPCPGGTTINCWNNNAIDQTFYTNNTGVTQRIWYIQDGNTANFGTFTLQWTLTPPAVCGDPSALTASGVGNTFATISWTAPGTPPNNGYDYYVSTSATAPTGGTTPSGSVAAGITSAALTGLTSNTQYYYWVRGKCECSVATWISSPNFMTTNQPYEVFFDPAPRSINDQVTIYFKDFDVINNFYTDGQASIWMYGGVQTSGPTNWQHLGSQDINTTGTLKEFTTTTYNGSTHFTATFRLTDYFCIPVGTNVLGLNLLFRNQYGTGGNNQTNDLYLDLTDATVAINPPTALANNTVTSTTANVTWTLPTTGIIQGTEYYVSTVNTAPTGGTIPTGSVATGVTTAALSSLSPSTTYYVWVRSMSSCNSDRSAWSASTSFTTACGIESLPYSWGFNATSSCWTSTIVVDALIDDTPLFFIESSSTNPTGFVPTEGANFLTFNSYDCDEGDQRRYASPSINTTGTNYVEVSFDFTQDNQYVDRITEGVTLQWSIDNGTTWNNADFTARRTPSADYWQNFTYVLPAGAGNQSNLKVGLLFTSDYGNDCHIDNLVVRAAKPITTLGNGTCHSTSQTNVAGWNWVKIKDGSGNVVAEINPNGQNLGTVTAQYQTWASVPQDAEGTHYLPRYFNLESSNAFSSNIDMRLFFKDGELSAYNTASGRTDTPADMNITWYSGPAEDCEIANNAYEGTLIASTDGDFAGSEGFYLGFQINHFTEFGGGGSSNALPIELTYFKGSKVNEASALIEWGTATETNNDYFVVERSNDGVTFREIGMVDGAGYSQEALNYRMFDNNPMAGNNYYRLRQVDYDGTSTTSHVVVLNFEKDFSVDVFPNPFNDKFSVDIYTQADGDATVEVFDITGRLVQNLQQVLQEGNNRIDIEGADLVIGSYMVRVKSGERVITSTVVKNK